MWWAIAALIVLLVLVARFTKKPEVPKYTMDDVRYLRHAIRVNVSIMSDELEKLKKQFEAAGEFEEKDKVAGYLENATEVETTAAIVASHAGHQELSKFLGTVFDAMNGTYEARRILDRYVPAEEKNA